MPTRVLIAEDEPNITAALRFLLEREGYRVSCVEDGSAAILEITAQPPDLLVLDVMLPSTNGFEVLKHIRSKPALARTKVLVLTAKGQPHDKKTASEIGADAFLTKPFANAEVLAVARQLAAP